MKKTRRKAGDIVKIRLEDNGICFAHILEEPLVAFYDRKIAADSEISLNEIVTLPVLFKVWVMNKAVTSGRWEVIGNVSPNEELLKPVKFFKQDRINKKISLYVNEEDIPATYKDCVGLERAAVWGAQHIEDRLRDHYLGVDNIWVESLKIEEI